ncbi:hypothetical protein [Clostridium perfringens]
MKAKDKQIIEVDVLYPNGKSVRKTLTVKILKYPTTGIVFIPTVEDTNQYINQNTKQDTLKHKQPNDKVQQRILPKAGEMDTTVGMTVFVLCLLVLVLWKARKE